MKVTRKIIKIDEDLCDGCGACVPSCAEGALEIIDGKARVIADKFCDGLGACLGECPQGALEVIEREADEFDEEAVEERLSDLKESEKAKGEATLACGCPSTSIQSFMPGGPCQGVVSNLDESSAAESALSHWPVQITLVPPTAPFLKGADLLVLADCVPVAFPSLHRDFLKGKAVMMGCPKLDNVEPYIEKFAQIFKSAGVKSITSVVMEVPCCAGLPMVVKKGLALSGAQIPMEEVVISTRGKIIRRIQN